MTKSEFMNILREVLITELPQNEIDSNIEFYKDYIEREGLIKSEQAVIDELGDPRLIAHTIIDTYKMNANVGYGSFQGYNRTSDRYNETCYKDGSYGNAGAYDEETSSNENRAHETYQQGNSYANGNYHMHMTQLKWYHKAIIIGILILIIALFIMVGGAILSFLLSFGIPILLILFIVSLVRRK